MTFLRKKLFKKQIWRRIYTERLTEPLHLNLIAAWVAIFGSFRTKVAYDLVVRPQHAYCLLKAADCAKWIGVNRITVMEFGVATGAGLLNMAEIASKVTMKTGVDINILGFDSGKGMPPPRSFKDHPELYQEGDFEMNFDQLEKALPENTKLILGDVANSVKKLDPNRFEEAPIAFISMDLDYYHSTIDALEICKLTPENYLPYVHVYMDDITLPQHNSKCEALAALNEFNEAIDNRVIEHHPFFVNDRIFQRAKWLKQVFYLQVLDHASRNNLVAKEEKRQLSNPYLNFENNRDHFNI